MHLEKHAKWKSSSSLPATSSFPSTSINDGDISIHDNYIYILDNSNRRVTIFTLGGEYINSLTLPMISNKIEIGTDDRVVMNFCIDETHSLLYALDTVFSYKLFVFSLIK